jgi:cytochrome c oxidase cbb3-type subunit III
VPNTTMPSFGFLDLKTRQSLVAYLRALQGATIATKLPGDVQRGREVFFGKGGCASCHMVRGQGGFFASDLSGSARGRSPESVRDSIVAPNRNLDPRRRTVLATLSNGTAVEGIARNEDNFSIQLLSPDGTIHLLSKSALAKLAYRDQSPMPADYGTKLSSSDLDDLVNFLFSLPEKKSNPKVEDEQEDD